MTAKWMRISLLAGCAALSSLAVPAQAQFDMLKNLGRSATATKQIACFKIEGAVAETPTRIPPLFGKEPATSLKSLLARFKEARRDNNVVAVVIDVQEAALGLAQLEEVHAALRQFAAVDKEVFVHADSLRTLTYAVATGASHVSVVPTGDVWLSGFYAETPYLRGALDKLGITPDFEQCGSHKSAAESLVRTGPSDAAREMMTWLFDGMYKTVVGLIADARDISPAKVRKLIDGGPYTAEEALELGLIDSIKHRQQFVSDLKKRYGKSVEFVVDYGDDDGFNMPSDNPFAVFQFIMELLNPSPKVYTTPSVAIVYVDGTIVTGESDPSPFSQASGAFSTSIRKALDEAADDDSVKAVVLRVDSPGGSALASEIILNATRRVAARKPLIVSMGNVAGSGGYYVTCAAETVFADEATITASIGVIAGKLVTTPMWDKLGINWYPHQRGEMAGMLSTATPFSDAERAKLRHYMEAVYETFKGHVVAARGEKLTKPIEEIAGGRVFTGRQALELGLVDRMGGLADAIKYAANRAGLGEHDIRVIPEAPTIFDLFLGGNKDEAFSRLSSSGTLSLMSLPMFQAALPVMAAVDPLRVKAIVRSLRRLELIHDERVIMMMPFEVVVR